MSGNETILDIANRQRDAMAPVAKAKGPQYRLADIDRLAGGKLNFINVRLVNNPKQPGSDAATLWPLQGKFNDPTVTVEMFLQIGAETRGNKGPMGRARVRADLLYNLNKGWVTISGLNDSES
jgi:hypothetical protein